MREEKEEGKVVAQVEVQRCCSSCVTVNVYLHFGICQLLRGQEICLICLFMDAVPLSHQPLCMFVFWVILFDENESKMTALYYETSVDTCRISQKYNPRTLDKCFIVPFH